MADSIKKQLDDHRAFCQREHCLRKTAEQWLRERDALRDALQVMVQIAEQPNRIDVPHYVKFVTVTFDEEVLAKARAALATKEEG